LLLNGRNGEKIEIGEYTCYLMLQTYTWWMVMQGVLGVGPTKTNYFFINQTFFHLFSPIVPLYLTSPRYMWFWLVGERHNLTKLLLISTLEY